MEIIIILAVLAGFVIATKKVIASYRAGRCIGCSKGCTGCSQCPNKTGEHPQS